MIDNAKIFELQLQREWNAKKEEIGEFVQEVAFDALRGVVQMSPVDTGRFKGNWFASIGSMNHATTDAKDPGGGATIARGAAVIEGYQSETFPMIYMQNNLPYAMRLEGGHSSQAPGGMVGVTLANISAKYAQRQI